MSGILIVPLANVAKSNSTPIMASPSPNAIFKYVVIIVLENKSYSQIIGNSCCPYLSRLANDSGVASNYFGVSNSGSLPNYLGLVAANPLTSWSTCNSTPLTCKGWPAGGDTNPTIIDRVEAAGLTWKAYMESYPGSGGKNKNFSTGGCYLADSRTGGYVANHDPFIWFSHIINNSTECAKIVDSGTNAATLVSDLSSNSTASNYMWLTPNLCDDSTTCSAATADSYLSKVVPQILNSPIFRSNRAAVYTISDKGWTTLRIPSIISGSVVPSGPTTRNNYTSTKAYTHYSILRTIESAWSLPSLTVNDTSASPMTEFFLCPGCSLQPSFTYSPSQPYAFGTVSFTASAVGGTGSYSFSWRFGDGATSTGPNPIHTYTSSGLYTVTIFASDTGGHNANSSQTVTVSAQPNFAIDPAGSWNPRVGCGSPWIVRISDLTDNMTGLNSLGNSTFGPGITAPTLQGSDGAKRWLTAGTTPALWLSPGPGCTITNSKGQTVASFVEIDGVGTGSMVYESDCSSLYDPLNGGQPQPAGHWCDNTFNIFDPALVPDYNNKCLTVADPTCYGLMHLEFDHDWMAGGYCGPTTTMCNNNTLASLVNPGSASTLFDFQGFVFWDPEHVSEAGHFFSGWELHALTGWRVHVSPPKNNPTTSAFSYLVVIPLENRGINATYGSSCAGNCTYITQLANTYGLALNYSGVAHDSFPNYLTMTSGGNFSYQPFVADCWPDYCPVSSPNLVDGFYGAGLSWKAYIEDYPTGGGCLFPTVNSTMYDPNHNPFLYYADILGNTTRCNRIVNANPGASGFLALPSALLSDLNSTNAPNFMWLSPNQCDDGHGTDGHGAGCPIGNGVSEVNQYLGLLVPKILSSRLFTTQNAALFITWDEGGSTPCPGPGQTYPTCNDRVAGIWVGRNVKPGYKSNVGYSHYSLSRTVENAWNISPPTPYDACVPAMTEFFKTNTTSLQASFTCSQGRAQTGQIITFTGRAQGGFAPYTFKWNFGDGGSGTGATISHAYTIPGSYKITFTVSDFYNNTVTSTTTLSIVSFSLTVAPGTTLVAGSPTSLTVSAKGAGSFTGNLTLTAQVSPNSGLACSLSPGTVSITTPGGSATSTLICNGSGGIYSTAITAKSGTVTVTSLTIITVQDVIVSANPNAITVLTNVPGISTITVAPVTGYNQTLALTLLTNSTRLVCSLSSSKIIGGSGTSTLSCDGLSPGNYLATVTATNGTLFRSASITYHVQDFNVTATPTTVTTSPGALGVSTIIVSPINGFTGTVTLAVTTNSTNLSCVLSMTSLSGSGTSVLSCTGSAIGNYLATVTGTTGTLSHTVNIVYHIQDFALSTAPTLITVNAGTTGSSTVTVTPVNGFAGTVTLSVTTNSTSISCTPASASIGGGSGTFMLSCTPSTAGTYLITITGTSNGLTHSATVTYSIQDFSISASPTSVTVSAGTPGTSMIAVSPVNGFAGTVALVVTTNSANLSCTLSSSSITGGSGTSTLSCSSNVAANYLATVTGTSASLSHSMGVTYHVAAAPDFSVTANPTSATVNAGVQGTSTITISPINGFTGTVALAVTTNSTSLSCTLSSASITGASGTSTLSCSGSPAGNYLGTVTGTSGTLSHSANVVFHVQDFSVADSPTSLSVNVGVAGTSIITLNPLNGFASTVALAVTTNSTNLSCTLSSNTINGGSGTSTLSCAGSLAGNYLATVTGTSGTLAHSSAVVYHVTNAPSFTVTASPTGLTGNAGMLGTSTISITPLNGFTGTVTLAVTTNSTNLSCTLNPTGITGGSGTSTLSCTGSPAGNYLATVTGTSPSVSPTPAAATVTYHLQDFILASNTTTVSVNTNATSTSPMTVAPVNGFAGTVALAAATNSTNLACTLSSTSIPGGSGTSNLSCSASVAGNYLATVTGTSDGLSHSAGIVYHVAAAVVPDFTISANPTSVPATVGTASTSTITVAPANGFTGTVTLTVTTSSSSLLCTLSSTSISGGSGSPTLTCTGSQVASFTANVTGVSGSLSHSATVTFNVTATPDFTVSVNPASVTVNTGVGGTSTITVSPLNGFTGTVTLVVATNSAYLSCNLSSSSISGGSGTDTMSCSSSVPANYLANVTATSGSLSHPASITFRIQDFTITAVPTSVGVNAGTTGTSTITIAPVNGFTGTVNLSLIVSPAGLNCQLNPTSVTLGSSQTSTLSCSGTAGGYAVTVTGTSGSTSHSVKIGVTSLSSASDLTKTPSAESDIGPESQQHVIRDPRGLQGYYVFYRQSVSGLDRCYYAYSPDGVSWTVNQTISDIASYSGMSSCSVTYWEDTANNRLVVYVVFTKPDTITGTTHMIRFAIGFIPDSSLAITWSNSGLVRSASSVELMAYATIARASNGFLHVAASYTVANATSGYYHQTVIVCSSTTPNPTSNPIWVCSNPTSSLPFAWTSVAGITRPAYMPQIVTGLSGHDALVIAGFCSGKEYLTCNVTDTSERSIVLDWNGAVQTWSSASSFNMPLGSPADRRSATINPAIGRIHYAYQNSTNSYLSVFLDSPYNSWSPPSLVAQITGNSPTGLHLSFVTGTTTPTLIAFYVLPSNGGIYSKNATDTEIWGLQQLEKTNSTFYKMVSSQNLVDGSKVSTVPYAWIATPSSKPIELWFKTHALPQSLATSIIVTTPTQSQMGLYTRLFWVSWILSTLSLISISTKAFRRRLSRPIQRRTSL